MSDERLLTSDDVDSTYQAYLDANKSVVDAGGMTVDDNTIVMLVGGVVARQVDAMIGTRVRKIEVQTLFVAGLEFAKLLLSARRYAQGENDSPQVNFYKTQMVMGILSMLKGVAQMEEAAGEGAVPEGEEPSQDVIEAQRKQGNVVSIIDRLRARSGTKH